MSDENNNQQNDLLKSFHEQFATNQNHHQTLFIQFLSAVLVVIVGYAIIYSNTLSNAQLYDITKDTNGSIKSYSITHLLGTYFIVQYILVLLGSLILNIGYSFRRDQKVNYNIRRYFLKEDVYKKIFEERSFNPTKKNIIFNSFLPGFNLIFFSFLFFLECLMFISIVVSAQNLIDFNNTFCNSISKKILTYFLLLSPIILSLRYFQHFYLKYKKTVK